MKRIRGILWGAGFWALAAAAMAAPAGPDAEPSFTVLCYHRFVDPLKPGERSPSGYQMPVDEFEWQMAYLKKEGIVPVNTAQVEAFLAGKGPLPEKAVLLAFDDGFESVYTKAYPVLKRYGYPGVLFLYTDFIGWRAARERAGKKLSKGEQALSLEEIGKMRDLLDLQSHTKSHFNLAKKAGKLGPKAFRELLKVELGEPRERIQEWFGKEPDWLAYPFGVYDPEVLKAAGEQGYRLALTVNPGPNDRTVPPLRLKRDLLLYPCRRPAFQALFTAKVLHLASSFPGDGEVVTTDRPAIEAVLEDEVDPRSVQWILGNQPLKTVYDPATRTARHATTAPLHKGGHMLTLRAKGKDGQERETTWYFRVDPKMKKGDE